ncbi:hypothetical protein FOA52_012659 [Chlamydomonas sp. UWO 241]|nr:hypothetical protein FOA52_012659 [Chlamydomonas sp. UWO 241]
MQRSGGGSIRSGGEHGGDGAVSRKIFCFREPTAAVVLGLTRYYNSSAFSDLTIVAPDGAKMAVHQVVLASCSRRFRDVLEQGDLLGEELPVRGVDAMRKLALRPSPPRAMGTRSKTLKDLNNLNLMALGAGMAAIAADAAAAAGGAGAGEESMEGVMVVAGTPSPRACLLTPGRGTRGATNAEVPSSAMSSPVRAPADHDEMHMGIPPPDPSAAMHRGMRELLREEFAEQRDLIREEFSRGMAALAARVTETEARVAGVIAAVATLDARITSKFAQADVAFGPLLRLVPELSVAKDGVADLDERMGRMEKHEVLALAQFHVDQGKSREMAAKVAALTEQVQALEAAARGGEAAGRQVPVAARAPVTVAQPVPAAQQQLPGPPQPPGPPPLPAAVSGGGLTFAVVVRERVSDARHALARGTERALTTLLGPHHVTVVQARVMFANDHKSKVVFTVANEGHAAFIRARMLLPRCTANMRRPGCAIFPHLPYAEHQSQRRMAMRGGNLRGEELPVRGVDAVGLDTVLRFFYQGFCNLDYTNVIPVYDAAHRLDVPGLVAACELLSIEELIPQTACTLLQQAQQFLMNDYAERCLSVIRANFEDVTLRQTDFLTCSFQTLAHILTDATSNQADEASVFRAAWRWGIAQLSHMQYLPEILKTHTHLQVVTVPRDLSIEELMTLATLQGGVVGPPAWLPLKQALMQHVLAGSDIEAAVRRVADEAAGVSLVAVAAGELFELHVPPPPPAQNEPALPMEHRSNLVHASAAACASGMMADGMQQAQQAQQQAIQAQEAQQTIQEMLAMQAQQQQAQQQAQQVPPAINLPPSHRGSDHSGLGGMPLPSPSGYDMLVGYAQNMPRTREAVPKGQCQVEDCYNSLTGLRDYHMRYKICEFHLKASSIIREGVLQRFCQQCGRFHHLTGFDGEKRSCRARLQKHNARRRKKDGLGQDADDQGDPKLPRHDGCDLLGYPQGSDGLPSAAGPLSPGTLMARFHADAVEQAQQTATLLALIASAAGQATAGGGVGGVDAHQLPDAAVAQASGRGMEGGVPPVSPSTAAAAAAAAVTAHLQQHQQQHQQLAQMQGQLGAAQQAQQQGIGGGGGEGDGAGAALLQLLHVHQQGGRDGVGGGGGGGDAAQLLHLMQLQQQSLYAGGGSGSAGGSGGGDAGALLQQLLGAPQAAGTSG